MTNDEKLICFLKATAPGFVCRESFGWNLAMAADCLEEQMRAGGQCSTDALVAAYRRCAYYCQCVSEGLAELYRYKTRSDVPKRIAPRAWSEKAWNKMTVRFPTKSTKTNDDYYKELERLLAQGLSVDEAKAVLVEKYGDYGEKGSETETK